MADELQYSGKFYRNPPQKAVEMQHLWKVMDDLQAAMKDGSSDLSAVVSLLGGYVQSVTGLNTDNTDPQNPVVQISVDGVTITGDGTSGNPLVAAGGVQSVTDDGNGFVTVDNTDPVNPVIGFSGYDLDAVLTEGNDGGGQEITNIADGTAADSAATVGQLDAIEYSYHIAAYGSNPPGATSFFISGSGFILITSLPDRIAIRPKYPILITKVQIMWQTIGTAGSNENISAYIRVNNTTDYLIATVGNTSTQKEFYNASMNAGAGIALNGTTDYYVVKFTTPTPATAWTNVNHQGEVFYLKT